MYRHHHHLIHNYFNPQSTECNEIKILSKKIKQAISRTTIPNTSTTTDRLKLSKPLELKIDNFLTLHYNIFNLEPAVLSSLDIQKYHDFLQFINTFISTSDFQTKQISHFTSNSSHTSLITEITEKYVATYSSKSPPSELLDYKKDLMNKKYEYDDTFRETHFGSKTHIASMSDEEFLELFNRRIQELEKCTTTINTATTTTTNTHPIKYNKDDNFKSTFYERAFKDETEMLEYLKTQVTLTIPEKLKYIATHINLGYKIIQAKDNLKSSAAHSLTALQNKLLTLLKDDNELEFLKTFLPPSIYSPTCNIVEKLKQQEPTNGGRSHFQTILGIMEHVVAFSNIPELFNSIVIQPSNYTCNNPFVDWSINLNRIYTRLALYSDVLFPIRFYKPFDSDNFRINEIMTPLNLKLLFSSSFDFIGMINIKMIYNNSNNSRLPSYRHKQQHQQQHSNAQSGNWILFIFKRTAQHNLEADAMTFDSITGLNKGYLITNIYYEPINEGELFPRKTITHQELTLLDEMRSNKTSPFHNRIFYYSSMLDNRSIFISIYDVKGIEEYLTRNKYPLDFLNSLQLYQIQLEKKDIKVGSNTKSYYETKSSSEPKILISFKITEEKIKDQTGGSMILKPTFTTKSIETLLEQSLDTGGAYKLFITAETNINTEFLDSAKYIYKYILVSPENIVRITHDEKLPSSISKHLIVKYKPFSSRFYYLNEILVHNNLLDGVSSISYLGLNPVILEVIHYNNYKIKNIDFIVSKSIPSSFINEENPKTMKEYELLYSIYSSHIKEDNRNIYELAFDPNIQSDQPKYNLVCSKLTAHHISWKYQAFYNVIHILGSIIIMTKTLKLDGSFLVFYGNVAHQPIADLHIITKKMFKTGHLYYPEISGTYKSIFACGVFKGFKGESACRDIIQSLEKALLQIQKEYPNGIRDFKIDGTHKPRYITGFLGLSIDDEAYDEIKQFNDEKYITKCNFIKDVLRVMKSTTKPQFPSELQINDSILYCRKYNIPYYERFNSKSFNDKMGISILQDIFEEHKPLYLKFNNSITATNATNASNSKESSDILDINKLLVKYQKPKNVNTKKLNMKLKYSSKVKSHKKNIISNEVSNVSRMLDDIDNRINQTNLLIDSRKDFDNMKSPNALYDYLKDKLRFYKDKGGREIDNIAQKIEKVIGETKISQGWIKMYEILVNCGIIVSSNDAIATFKSFHYCEAPGNFIRSLNHYIHTKTKIQTLDWHAQSLNPNIADIGDTYGLILKWKSRWDWGATSTGDITVRSNIEYYARKCRERGGVDLITSDAGLPFGNPNYTKVAVSSLIAILVSATKGTSMIYKVLTPLENPILINLIYICFCSFNEMSFYKPVQNGQSREFYIICKGFKGVLEPSITTETLLDIVDNFKHFEDTKKDLFNDTYPRIFTVQFIHYMSQLADNYSFNIEKIIYYIDHWNELGKSFESEMEKYIEMKNDEWIKRYNIIKNNPKWKL
jgi:hypothetical protein